MERPPDLFCKLVIVVESTIQNFKKAELARFARRAQKLAGVSGEIAVLIADNHRIRELNRRFRKKNQPTDVLSFPRQSGGDIAISAEIALENAGLYGHAPLEDRKSTRLNSSHSQISYAVFCLKKKK